MRKLAVLALLTACAPEMTIDIPVTKADDVDGDGKADSSVEATILDFEVTGEVVSNFDWAPEDVVREQLFYSIGELNASHLGANAPQGTFPTTTGRLGLRFDRGEYERAGRLKITEVIPLSPAALGGIKTGEYLVAVDGAAISPRGT